MTEREPQAEQDVKVTAFIDDVPLYLKAGQVMGVRGFNMTEFSISTGTTMNHADLVLKGPDASLVSYTVKKVQEAAHRSNLDQEATTKLLVDVIELMGAAKRTGTKSR